MAVWFRFDPTQERETQHDIELGSGNDGRSFTIRTEWSRRMEQWLFSMWDGALNEADPGANAICINVPLRPGTPMVLDTNRLQSTLPLGGLVICRGPENYVQSDLGDALRVGWFKWDLVPAAVDDLAYDVV